MVGHTLHERMLLVQPKASTLNSVHVGADATSTLGTPSVSHAHDDNPVQKAVNSGMGFIVGDILAQRLTGEAFDAVRSLELGLYGTLLGMLYSSSPMLYYLAVTSILTSLLVTAWVAKPGLYQSPTTHLIHAITPLLHVHCPSYPSICQLELDVWHKLGSRAKTLPGCMSVAAAIETRTRVVQVIL